ncbi:MAG: pre-16S rRNA-processing nuclease YqgF [Selenomonadaceae bacterium]|nr:pre-16S rRNA-processing nuclease YqgF [Selenomonadaceae bacterium]
MDKIAALDPGRDKCGFAVVAMDGSVVTQKIIDTITMTEAIKEATEGHGCCRLVMGNGTTSSAARERIEKVFPELEVEMVDEYNTTQLAKGEYWKANPPRGLKKLIPITMQVPPVPVDDYVAVILARRYIAKNRR